MRITKHSIAFLRAKGLKAGLAHLLGREASEEAPLPPSADDASDFAPEQADGYRRPLYGEDGMTCYD